MEFQLNYFKPLKMMLWMCFTQYASKFGELSSGHKTQKVSFHSDPKERQCKRMFRLQLHSSYTLAKSCSKFSKPGFSSMWTKNFQTFKLDLEKAEEPEIKLPTFIGSLKNQENSRKASTSASLTTLNIWRCRSQKAVERFKGTVWPVSWEPICRSRSSS